MPIVSRSGNYDYIDWKVPIEHFLWDRLAEAHAEATALSAGSHGVYLAWYRMIEAEWLVRDRGEIVQVNDALKVERILDETGDGAPLGALIAAICEDTARSFQVEERPEVLVSILSAESDAPWVEARAGYFIDKFPYDKICIPQGSAFDEDDLREVVAHEYTHALNLSLTQGKCPLWLNEGLAMLAQVQLDPALRRDFAAGREPWMAPHPLDAAFHAELQGDRDYSAIHRAYEQAAWIVRYLLTLGDRAKLADLMRAFNDDSIMGELRIRITNQDHADEALRQVFGRGQAQVFAEAYEWLKVRAF